MRSAPRSAALVALVAAGCTQPGGAAIDAGIDAAAADTPDAGPFVPGGPFVPATIRFDRGGGAFGPCELAGQPVAYGGRVLVDDCVECQCTTYGLRCRKRATCPDDRCVFVDGQVVARGGTAIVETCFDCQCGAEGAACRRRTAAPCPADGCLIDGDVIAIGAQRFVSECHACSCDLTAGLSCQNLCHPVCACNGAEPGCEVVCTEYVCPLVVPDQEWIELACGSLVCDYGGLIDSGACAANP